MGPLIGGRQWPARHPLVLAAAIVAVSVAVALGVAEAGNGKGGWHDDLRVAAVTLIFGALIGGVVKLLLDDVQIARAARAERARFLQAVLDDLKSAYDRVERARILIRADRSARTYGDEMRSLIDARVQLKNVVRALDTSGLASGRLSRVATAVRAMEGYLAWLNEEFEEHHRSVSDEQQVYEARRAKALEEMDARGRAPEIPNEPWKRVERLPRLSRFIRGSATEDEEGDYERDFRDQLNCASAVLRAELQAVLGRSSP